jgi:hypothetical protein
MKRAAETILGATILVSVASAAPIPRPGEGGLIKLPSPAVDEDPLKDLAERMDDVSGDLDARHTGKPVQQKQKQIVVKLDALIEKLEKRCQGCKGCKGGSNPTSPLADSIIAGGPGGVGDLHAPRKVKHQLESLKPEQRKQILQSLNEGFPAGYESILTEYYKRLAKRASESP